MNAGLKNRLERGMRNTAILIETMFFDIYIDVISRLKKKIERQ